jgi:hypothetical protein
MLIETQVVRYSASIVNLSHTQWAIGGRRGQLGQKNGKTVKSYAGHRISASQAEKYLVPSHSRIEQGTRRPRRVVFSVVPEESLPKVLVGAKVVTLSETIGSA